MTKIEFKKKVLDWIASEKIFPKKVRVYDTRRYGLEVRIYHEPMRYISDRISFRTTSIEKVSENSSQRHGTRGHHVITKALYTPINESNLATKEERDFTLECLRSNS